MGTQPMQQAPSLPCGRIEQAIIARMRQAVMVADRSGELVYVNPRASAHYQLRAGSNLSGQNEEDSNRLARTLIRAATADQWLPVNLSMATPGSDPISVKFLACGMAMPNEPPLVLLLADPSRDRQFAKLNEVLASLTAERERNRRLEQQLRLAISRLREIDMEQHASA